MTSASIVGGCNVTDTIRARGQVVALFETGPSWIIRVVHGNGVPAVFSHDSEARDVSWTIPDIDHVRERDRARFIRHVVIDILRHVQQAFVDAEKVLSLLRVANHAFREGDFSFGVLRILASEDFPDIRTDLTTLDQ